MKTAEEILKEKFKNSFLDLDYIDLHLETMIEFAKMHVSEALTQAQYKVTISDVYNSIANSYPLENIQ